MEPPRSDSFVQRSHRTYRGVFWWKGALRHIVLPEPESLRRTRRKLVRPFLRYEQGFALLAAGYVSAQEREELVPQHGFDPLEGMR